METFQKLKSKVALALLGLGAGLAVTAPAYATPVVDNDTLEGMPQIGSDIGDFLANLAPGIGVFILIMGIFLGIVGILGGIVYLITKVAGRGLGKVR